MKSKTLVKLIVIAAWCLMIPGCIGFMAGAMSENHQDGFVWLGVFVLGVTLEIITRIVKWWKHG